MWPWCIIPLLGVGHPGHNPRKDRLASAFHTTAIQVISCHDRFEPFKQRLLLYKKQLRIKYCHIETTSAYQSPWQVGETQHPLHGRGLQSPWSTPCPFLRFARGRPARLLCYHQLISRSTKRTPTIFDIVARKFGNPVHHVEQPRNNFLEEGRLFADNFIRDLIRQR